MSPNKFATKIGAFSAIIVCLMLTSTGALAQDAESVPELTKEDLVQYQGSYEGRDFRLNGSTLTYHRGSMPMAMDLEVIGEDHFAIVIPEGLNVRTQNNQPIPTFKFHRNDEGVVVRMSILTPTGDLISEHAKTDELDSVGEEAKKAIVQ